MTAFGFGAVDAEAVIGTVVNPAGLTLAKVVPASRAAHFADPGLGASPTWHGFAIDRAGIAFTDEISVVGDQRIRIDLDALRVIDSGLAWAPGQFYDRSAEPVAACARGTLRRVESRLAQAGLRALVGHEIEFLLVDPAGGRLPAGVWAPYGAAGVLEYEDFIRDVLNALGGAGVGVEQFHPEYGVNQFELSLAAQSPVAAADQLVLARILVSRMARRHGVRVCLSPAAFPGGVGSGAHQHFSLHRGDTPLFGGGCGDHDLTGGLTREGRAAIAGVVSGLTEAELLLCGSIVSGLRLKPGNWAGAYVCWGTENREAAVRFIPGTRDDPQAANVEVKAVDPSANPYLATAAILGLALDGIERALALQPEIRVDPDALTDAERAAAGVGRLTGNQVVALDALDRSHRLRAILGDPVIDAVLAVRSYEQRNYADLGQQDLADRFRMAWSL